MVNLQQANEANAALDNKFKLQLSEQNQLVKNYVEQISQIRSDLEGTDAKVKQLEEKTDREAA